MTLHAVIEPEAKEDVATATCRLLHEAHTMRQSGGSEAVCIHAHTMIAAGLSMLQVERGAAAVSDLLRTKLADAQRRQRSGR